MMKKMDVKAIIEQLETGEQDIALRALQSYNKEVTLTVELRSCNVKYMKKIYYSTFIAAQIV